MYGTVVVRAGRHDLIYNQTFPGNETGNLILLTTNFMKDSYLFAYDILHQEVRTIFILIVPS